MHHHCVLRCSGLSTWERGREEEGERWEGDKEGGREEEGGDKEEERVVRMCKREINMSSYPNSLLRKGSSCIEACLYSGEKWTGKGAIDDRSVVDRQDVE